MTLPLGFRRSTRKKLRRCEHPDVDAWQDPTQPANIVECAACGVRVSVPHRGLPASLNYFSSWLPETIARSVPWRPV